MLTKCHFIGIGGIGMSGLAKLLLKRNVEVTGSDISNNPNVQSLAQAGAKVHIGHSSAHIQAGVPVVYSSDIPRDNPEFAAAVQLQCPLWHRSDLLSRLMEGKKALVVSGTHGKTTTTSLLTAVLLEAGYDPAYAVGGVLNQLQTNAGHGEGDYFVAEGDESDGTFLKYSPFGAIVTNIDFDHMNFYKTEKALVEAFDKFIKGVRSPGNLFWYGEDKRLAALNPPGISYGFAPSCRLRIENFKQSGWASAFDILFDGKRYPSIQTTLTGEHNALNAAAVFGSALQIGIPEQSIRKAFKAFGGVKRRCDKKGEARGVEVYDDYAHHPTEIETTLKAIRQAVPDKRLIAVFQPHRYSRMEHCLGTFGQCFKSADEIFITDLYSSGETPIPGVTTEAVVKEVEANHTAPCRYVSRVELVKALEKHAKPNDVIVTLGAGDITKVGPELIHALTL